MNRFSTILVFLFGCMALLSAQTVVKIPFQQSPLFVVQPQEVYKTFDGSTTIELGLEAEILGGSGVYGFSWTLNGVQVGVAPTLTVTQKGTYVLAVTDGAGCQSSITYHIDMALGAKEAAQPLLTLFPNPSYGLSYLQTPEMQKLKRVEVYGVEGKLWLSLAVPDNTLDRLEINTSQLTAGRYLVVAYFDSKKITKLLVVK